MCIRSIYKSEVRSLKEKKIVLELCYEKNTGRPIAPERSARSRGLLASRDRPMFRNI